jgi:hypothetical protein
MTEKQLPQIERIEPVWQPKAWLKIGDNRFVYPTFEGNYSTSGKQILEKGLSLATGDQIADLLRPAYCVPEVAIENEFQNIRDTMKQRWLWVGNRILWTDKGVYVVQDPKAIGRTEDLTVRELEDALRDGKEFSWGGVRVSSDKTIRFAPKGSYNFGEHTPDSFAEDGFIIASVNPEGAKKMGEISSKFRYLPTIFGKDIREGGSPELRLSAVDDCNGRLSFNCSSWNGGGSGRAFGVKK